jgi:uncharacterized protein YuzE
VTEPEAIYEGKAGECLAAREVERGKYIVVVYREVSKEDGFIITAFLTKRKEAKAMAAIEVESVLPLVPRLLEIPHRRIWTTYDQEADVLYINFKKPSHADDSELTDDDIIIRYEGGQIVGITILNASKREIK